MTVTLRKGPRENIPEINYKHNPLSKRQLQQVYFPHNHGGEKKKKSKKPYIHRTRCSASQIITGGMPIKTTRNKIPSVRMTTLRSPQTINGGEGQEERDPPYTTGGKGHWQ